MEWRGLPQCAGPGGVPGATKESATAPGGTAAVSYPGLLSFLLRSELPG